MNELFAQYTRDSQHLVERHNHRFKTNIAELTRKNNQIKEQCRQLVQVPGHMPCALLLLTS